MKWPIEINTDLLEVESGHVAERLGLLASDHRVCWPCAVAMGRSLHPCLPLSTQEYKMGAGMSLGATRDKPMAPHVDGNTDLPTSTILPRKFV